MVDKKLVATTVSSREIEMQRRINPVTTSSHDEKTNRNEEAKEEMNRIHISFKRKDSKKLFITRDKKESKKTKKKEKEKLQQALEAQCHRGTKQRKQWKAKASTPGQKTVKATAAAAKPRLRIEATSRRRRQHSLSCKKHKVNEFE